MNQNRYSYICIIGFLLSLLVSGCVNSGSGAGILKRDIAEKPPRINEALLSVFCDFTEQPSQQMNLQISDMEIQKNGEQS